MSKRTDLIFGLLLFLNSQTNVRADRIAHAPIVQLTSVHGGYHSDGKYCTSANVPPPYKSSTGTMASPTTNLVQTSLHHITVFLKNISAVPQEVRIKVTQAAIGGATSNGLALQDASFERPSFSLSNAWTSAAITIPAGTYKAGLFVARCHDTK
ncbi:MAG: hypothetical protein ACKOA8_13905, partial [Deltaproteobacteria bacterium]